MCGSIVDIQSANAEIRTVKKKKEGRRKKQDKNIMSASATQSGIISKYDKILIANMRKEKHCAKNILRISC